MAKENLLAFRSRTQRTIALLEQKLARTTNIAKRKLLLLQIENLREHVAFTPTTELGIGTTGQDALRKAHSPRR